MKGLALIPLLASSAAAWGVAGHEITATIAQVLLTEKTREQVALILPEWTKGHLAPVAAWADSIKRDPWWRSWTSSMHYVNPLGDWPSTHCEFGESGWVSPDRNLFLAINNYTRIVDVAHGIDQDHALRFLIHYIGDLHQPLHLSGREKGGNNLKVRFDNHVYNLHSVWDGGFITKAVREISNYTEPLSDQRIERALRGTIYDPYVRWIIKEGLLGWWKDEYLSWPQCPDEEMEAAASLLAGDSQARFTFAGGKGSLPDDPDLPACPHHWGAKLHPLNCEIIFPPQLDAPNPNDRLQESSLFTRLILKAFRPLWNPRPVYPNLDTPAYSGVIRDHKLVEKLLAMGGVRLAAVLNDIFDPPRFPGQQRDVLA